MIPWAVAHHAPLSMGFPRQEYWNMLSFPLPGDLPNPGIEPMSPALICEFFTTVPPGKPLSDDYMETNVPDFQLGEKIFTKGRLRGG